VQGRAIYASDGQVREDRPQLCEADGLRQVKIEAGFGRALQIFDVNTPFLRAWNDQRARVSIA
jgi:hypothetical protein